MIVEIICISYDAVLFWVLLISFTTASYFADLFEAYSQDMCVKESMVGDITRQNDRDILTVYLLCWLHQPYITTQCTEKLEALLIDSGLRT